MTRRRTLGLGSRTSVRLGSGLRSHALDGYGWLKPSQPESRLPRRRLFGQKRVLRTRSCSHYPYWSGILRDQRIGGQQRDTPRGRRGRLSEGKRSLICENISW